MQRKGIVLILLAAFVLLLAGAYVLYDRLGGLAETDQLATQSTADPTQPQTQDYPAPDFVVYDANGKEVRLSDYFGKPIVLNFWASWCGPCKMEMPDFQERYQTLGEEVTFLMVNMTGGRETQASASTFIKSQGFTFPVLYDLDGSAATVYRVYSLPTTYFIDAQGNLIANAVGAISASTLQQGIDLIR